MPLHGNLFWLCFQVLAGVLLILDVDARSHHRKVHRRLESALKGNYIVVLKDTLKPQAAVLSDHSEILREAAIEEGSSWSTPKSAYSCLNRADACILRSFPLTSSYTAKLTDSMVEILQKQDVVDFIEPDLPIFPFGVSILPPKKDLWGLRRIANRTGLSVNYTYPDPGGEGIDVYVLDTGIKTNHTEFEGRATFLRDFTGEGDDDLVGHGTHVSGSIGGVTFGVAKKVSIFGVKVLALYGGSTSTAIAGINFVIGRVGALNKEMKSVINMSLGGGKSLSLNAAVESAVNAGIVVVVAAGNKAQDACLQSPASSTSALTVGASDRHDTIAGFSNFGTCVDLFGPGVSILSASINGNNTAVFLSGTSMATPHVAGVVALALASNPGRFQSVPDFNTYLTDMATFNVILGDLKGGPNLLLFNKVDKDSVPLPRPTTTTTTTTGTFITTSTAVLENNYHTKLSLQDDHYHQENDHYKDSKDCRCKINYHTKFSLQDDTTTKKTTTIKTAKILAAKTTTTPKTMTSKTAKFKTNTPKAAKTTIKPKKTPAPKPITTKKSNITITKAKPAPKTKTTAGKSTSKTP
ncbi:subtilisin-like serine protease [Nowakowskiella sp. JEL0407]|nr:subtilisin-like serine protease [Nowakowskiella sp. JEL0407]